MENENISEEQLKVIAKVVSDGLIDHGLTFGKREHDGDKINNLCKQVDELYTVVIKENLLHRVEKTEIITVGKDGNNGMNSKILLLEERVEKLQESNKKESLDMKWKIGIWTSISLGVLGNIAKFIKI